MVIVVYCGWPQDIVLVLVRVRGLGEERLIVIAVRTNGESIDYEYEHRPAKAGLSTSTGLFPGTICWGDPHKTPKRLILIKEIKKKVYDE